MIITNDFTKFDPTGTGELDFVTRKGNPNATVHIKVNVTEEDVEMYGSNGMVLFMRTLCGRRISGFQHDYAGTFDDSRICKDCHRCMGENSFRIFERDQFTYAR